MDGGYTMDKHDGGFDYSWDSSEGFLGGANWTIQNMAIAFGVGFVIIAIIIIIVYTSKKKEDMCNGVIKDGSASGVQYYGEFSGANQGKGNPLAADAWDIRNCQLGGVDHFVEGMTLPGPSEEFIGGRETPYFSDVTNRVLRLENREKDAIRALAKINQERLRRQAERPDATVPWDSHWAEWKRTNPLGEEQLI